MTGDSDFTNAMSFVEKASLEVAVPASRTVALIGKSTSTGELVASSGKILLAAQGRWDGTIRVKDGASFALESCTSLSKATVLRLEGGTATLPAGITLVGALVDAAGVSRAPGLYAATAADGAAAVDGLAGDGFLQVMPASARSTSWRARSR